MFRDLCICLLSGLNILIFSFIVLNGQALRTVDAFEQTSISGASEFDHITQKVQKNISKQQWIREKKLREKSDQIISVADSHLATISIPSINISAPIIFHDHLTSEQAQQKLEQGTISLNEFIPPSQTGQTIIFGHSSDYPWRNNAYGNVFTLLPQLEIGDEITLRHGKRLYRYAVERSLITPTGLEGLINDNPISNELILSTCYPIGFFSKRFNIIAKPVKN